MPDALSAALALPGLGWLVAGAFMAGLVRGFSGFGTGMIYLPIAAQFLSPVWALVTLMIFDIAGPLPNLPRAWRGAHRRDLLLLTLGTVLALPLAIWLLVRLEPAHFRYIVSFMALFLLVVLMTGWRYARPLAPAAVVGVGGMGGFLGGVAGLPGPPVILTYMASVNRPEVVRANIMLYIFVFDLLLVAGLVWSGRMQATPLWLGVILIVPSLLGNLAGGAIFRPEAERVYRAVAYLIIAVSALSGLPFWD